MNLLPITRGWRSGPVSASSSPPTPYHPPLPSLQLPPRGSREQNLSWIPMVFWGVLPCPMSYTNLLPLACQHPAHWITLTGAISPRGTGVPSPGEFHLANPAKCSPLGSLPVAPYGRSVQRHFAHVLCLSFGRRSRGILAKRRGPESWSKAERQEGAPFALGHAEPEDAHRRAVSGDGRRVTCFPLNQGESRLVRRNRSLSCTWITTGRPLQWSR